VGEKHEGLEKKGMDQLRTTNGKGEKGSMLITLLNDKAVACQKYWTGLSKGDLRARIRERHHCQASRGKEHF